MIRTINNAFRTAASKINLQDLMANSGTGGWTQGATIIDGISLQPLPSERWTLLDYSINGILGLDLAPNAGPLGYVPFGKFGKLRASLVLGSDFSSQSGNPNVPFVRPILPMPADSTTASDLWDPAVSPLPQISKGFGGLSGTLGFVGIPVSCAVQLPQPRVLQLGEQLGIGMWMTPSLLNAGVTNFPSLYLWQCVYSIVYDDGH